MMVFRILVLVAVAALAFSAANPRAPMEHARSSKQVPASA